MSLISQNRTTSRRTAVRSARVSTRHWRAGSCFTAGPGSSTRRIGRGGVVLTDFPTVEKGFHGSAGAANAVQIQSDGKIVVAGEGLHDFALAHYNTNGSLDSTFGTGGKVVTDVRPNHRGTPADPRDPAGREDRRRREQRASWTRRPTNHFAIARLQHQRDARHELRPEP